MAAHIFTATPIKKTLLYIAYTVFGRSKLQAFGTLVKIWRVFIKEYFPL